MSTGVDQRTQRGSADSLLSHVAEFERDIDRILISGEDVQAKIRELGDRITEDYSGRDLLLVGVLKGAFMFMSDLARASRLPEEFNFKAVSS